MGTFFHKLHTIWTKFFGSAPDWLSHVQMVLSFAAPLAVGILTQLSPEDAPEAKAVVNEIQKNFTLATALLQHDTSTSVIAQVRGYLTSIHDHLGDLLSAGHIKNPTTLAKVQGIADTITAELTAVLGILPQ